MSDNGGTRAIVVAADQGHAIVAEEYEGLRMVVSPKEALRRVQELQAFVREVMQEGVDFGRIPGTGDKPVLLQPGAQKLCEIYGLAWTFEDAGSTQDWDRGLFVFRKRCVLSARRDGRPVGDGIGSCNSKEDRYAYRWAPEKAIPKGVDKATLKNRPGKFGLMFRMPNDDVFSLVNTMEKMACKRALVHAVLGATRSSGLFSQDLEDLPREVFGQAEAGRSWETKEAPVTPSADDAALVDVLTAQIAEAGDEKFLRTIGKAIADAAGLSDQARKGLRAEYAKRRAHLAKHAKDAAPKAEPSADDFDQREPGED